MNNMTFIIKNPYYQDTVYSYKQSDSCENATFFMMKFEIR